MSSISHAHSAYLQHKAYNLRKLSLLATTAAGSGHPTSALSAADMIVALFFHAMKYDLTNPHNPDNDRFILSKGHAIPAVYAAWEQAGVITQEQLMSLRKFDSVLEGHPTARFVYNEAATGSLGMGLSIGLGMALSTRISKHSFTTYVMLGDSEMAEGSVWEAFELAAYYKVNNLVALIDVNRLGQTTQTMEGWNTEDFKNKCIAFGWNALVVDGHDMEQLVHALDTCKLAQSNGTSDKPSVIIAKTVKGYGLSNIENLPGYHGKAFSWQELPRLLEELYKRFTVAADYQEKPIEKVIRNIPQQIHMQAPMLKSKYKDGDKVATRKAYGEALSALGALQTHIISLDAEVKNSTFADLFEQVYPERFFQSFIAEQNMVAMAIGFALRGFVPFVSTFGAFFTRAHDQIRMASIGKVPLRLVGSHCGVSIGEDGPSQMALEDIALFRATADSIILYPCDGTSTFKLMTLMANYYDGVSYLRTTREATPILYGNDEEFIIGGSKVVKESENDEVCIVAAGITLHETLKAYEILKNVGVLIAVIDAYSIKPLDSSTIKRIAYTCGRRIITVEDHYIQGGLGEAVCASLINDDVTVINLAVRQLSRSGSKEALMKYHKIDSQAIVDAVMQMRNLND